jgi:hypothetical protein
MGCHSVCFVGRIVFLLELSGDPVVIEGRWSGVFERRLYMTQRQLIVSNVIVANIACNQSLGPIRLVP